MSEAGGFLTLLLEFPVFLLEDQVSLVFLKDFEINSTNTRADLST